VSESVEQAALRRAAHDELPAPFRAIFAAVDAVARLNDTRYRDLSDRYRYVCDTNAALEVQVSEQSDAILALSNRIEAVTRVVFKDADGIGYIEGGNA
jgi:hypothetical protein